MLDLFGRMMRLPFVLMGYVFEMAAVTARGLDQITEQSLNGAPRMPQPVDDRRWWNPTIATTAATEPVPVPRETSFTPPEGPVESRNSPDSWQFPEPRTREEKTTMADTNLNDDMVKLVEYSIVTIERGSERILKGPSQVIVTDDLTGNAFSNARIADWCDGRDRSIRTDTLRVYYNVLDRWPKEDLKKDERKVDAEERQARYLEEQVTVLREIADKIGTGPGPTPPPAKKVVPPAP